MSDVDATVPYPELVENEEKPYQSEELLRKLYHDERKSMLEISKILDCGQSTISEYFQKFEIETRSLSQQQSISHGYDPGHVTLWQHHGGYMVWKNGDKGIAVHRLLAIAEYGFDAVDGNQVHHKNGIPWDNRHENVEPVTTEEHGKKHRKVSALDRLRIAELYENGDISSRDLADHIDHDIVSTTVLGIHDEFYGDAS